MLLSELFDKAPAVEINQLSCDSRIQMKDCIFFCYKGIKYNGHQFIDEAIANGANVIVYEDEIAADRKAIYIRVSDVTETLNRVADKFYNYPAKEMETYVTVGSYGRSTVSHLIAKIINKYKKCGSIGITGINYGTNKIISTAPTLTMLDNCRYLKKMKELEFEACTFEANALSVSFHKIDIVDPKVFIFTSTGYLSKDYREVGKEYFEIFRRYLYTLEDDSLIVLNRDDVSYNELFNVIGSKRLTYGKSQDADFVISDIDLKKDGTVFELTYENNTYTIETQLIGESNVYNATAAIASLSGMGYDLKSVIEQLATVSALDGVFERVNINPRFNIYIDCAKTIESIEAILKDLKTIKESKGRLIAVASINSYDDDQRIISIIRSFEKYADLIFYTEDNSELKEMNLILDKVASYAKPGHSLLVENRKGAIEMAVSILNPNDMLAILGKGSENFISRNLSRDYYETDRNNAISSIKKRLDEEIANDYNYYY